MACRKAIRPLRSRGSPARASDADNPDNRRTNPFDTPRPRNTNSEPPQESGSPPPSKTDQNPRPSTEHEPPVNDVGRDNPPSSRRTDGARLPLPTGSARQAAQKTLHEIYGVKIAVAKTGPEKIALADQIWRQALTTKNDAALRYVLMFAAYQLTGESGRLQSAMDRADTIGGCFETDAWDLKLQAAANAVKVAQLLQTARNNP